MPPRGDRRCVERVPESFEGLAAPLPFRHRVPYIPRAADRVQHRFHARAGAAVPSAFECRESGDHDRYGFDPAEATQRAVKDDTLSSWSAQRISAPRSRSTPAVAGAPRARERLIDRWRRDARLCCRARQQAQNSPPGKWNAVGPEVERKRISRGGTGQHTLCATGKRQVVVRRRDRQSGDWHHSR